MTDSFFDSNVCVYLFDERYSGKRQCVFDLLKKQKHVISSQVIIESFLACRKKLKLSEEICITNVKHLRNICFIAQITAITIDLAMIVKSKYRCSMLDSIIIATALDAGCTTLYSEDLRHKQVIENTLTIINPFVTTQQGE